MGNSAPVQYAVSCLTIDENDLPSIFFVRFNTRSEKEAQTLAKCIGAPSEHSILILDENGFIY